MKAVICTKYGGPEVLQLSDLPKPRPKAKQVLIKNYASAVTMSDIYVRGMSLGFPHNVMMRVIFGFRKPRKKVIGFMVAGEVVEVGDKVTKFKVGDKVFGFTMFALGAFAQYVVMPEKGTVEVMPSNQNYVEAAATVYGALLGGVFLERCNLKPGSKILIYGASGGIGSTALQLAKAAGAHVTAVCSARNHDMVREIGADAVIDYTTTDTIPNDEKFDAVLDAVGTAKTSKLKDAARVALTENGVYVSVDDGTPSTGPEFLVAIRELVEAGQYQTIIDRTYPLEELADAHAYVEKGHKSGNVIITIDHDN